MTICTATSVHASVSLRGLRQEDSEILYGWINDRELVELSAPFRTVTREEHERWFQRVRQAENVRIFAILDTATDATIGYCQLKEIDQRAKCAELQIRIGLREYMGRGAGEQAVTALLRHAFTELDLHRIYLHVFASNQRARACYLKCGFKIEGALRDAALVNDRYTNILMMAILRKEFEWHIVSGHADTKGAAKAPGDWSDFTEGAYERIVCLAKERYTFCSYPEGLREEKAHVIWRHDVDMSVHRALRMATIERELGVKATYLFLLSSNFYNLFEAGVLKKVKEIAAMGHDVGLHFDMTGADAIGATTLEAAARRQCRWLEDLLQTPIRTLSFHNPELTGALGHDQLELGGMLNVYSRAFRERYKYCSDSNGYWRFEPLPDLLASGAHPYVHALTHPEWWTPLPMPPRERVERCVLGRAGAVMEDYDSCLEQAGRWNVRS